MTAKKRAAAGDAARRDAEVLAWFSSQMAAKLAANRHKPGWKDDVATALIDRIRDETYELHFAVLAYPRDTPEYRKAIVEEAADVANFAMMVADNHRELERAPTPDTARIEKLAVRLLKMATVVSR